ncbi:signal recognition particle protein [Enterobacteriaceae endosymbiont of Plateumaris consimilis]|uniref:signal recognition particle protein n=1 Tax=Enterobacteriaceae endosymbiont of Plateumaris consimilis TaxID=2675794 RepID=UPI001449DEFC|nr:signal recognition particle receptor subunit alpha [Enterobacteriaceae endosymbiont of Plateumaris consimilis]QJC28804.1 signal recognition particle protein [Enterobacteriaceae endosymbiont of Plateumaris consimilis]
MFENLRNKLSKTLSKISNYGRLTEKNIKDTLDKISNTLLEADVSFKVVNNIIHNLKKNAIGKKINNSFTPGQELIKLIKNNLIKIMGESDININLAVQPPAVILLAGLQGVGKTTSVVKLAYFLKKKYKKKIIVASTDIYRPAAMEQLKILSQQIKIDCFNSNKNISSEKISQNALNYAKINFYDILIIDTSGRLHIDNNMMDELKNIHNHVNPIETIFVVDSMTGQDAVNSAYVFNKILPLTGIFLTKTDGDSRGGAALSIRYITNKPIKFIGTGEKIDKIEIFSPKKIAIRILGMKEELSSIKDIENKINNIKNHKLIKKFKDGKQFSIVDFLNQIKQISKIGNNNITKLINTMSLRNINHTINPISSFINTNNNIIIETQNIINSMTVMEKLDINIINYSRKKRISMGSGVSIQKINVIFKQYSQFKLISKKMKNNYGIKKMFRNIKNVFPKKFF